MMKQHIAAIAEHNKRIDVATENIDRLADRIPKFRAARDAAHQQHASLRTQASHALALAAVGEHDNAVAQKTLSESEQAEKRLSSLELTLVGMEQQRTDAEAELAAARSERADAITAALVDHAHEVAAQYRDAALPFIAALRRVHALEFIFRTRSDNRSLFRHTFEARELNIPSLNDPCCDDLRVGASGESLYRASHDLNDWQNSPQGKAVDAEIALLAKAGLEV